MKQRSKFRPQAMVEYIIIVAVVAIAALGAFAYFSDTLRTKIFGAGEALGGARGYSADEDALDNTSSELLRGVNKDGLE